MKTKKKSRRAVDEIIGFIKRQRGVEPEQAERLERLGRAVVHEIENGRSAKRLHAAIEKLMSELLK